MLCLGAVVFVMGSVRSVFKSLPCSGRHMEGLCLWGQELHPVPSVVQLSLLLVWSSPDLWFRIAACVVM